MRPKLSWDPFYVPADRGGDVRVFDDPVFIPAVLATLPSVFIPSVSGYPSTRLCRKQWVLG